MVKISIFDPANYIDSEALAREYLLLARSTGDAALLASAMKDVEAARKIRARSAPSVDQTPDNSLRQFDHLKN